jgi:hypothetical protein
MLKHVQHSLGLLIKLRGHQHTISCCLMCLQHMLLCTPLGLVHALLYGHDNLINSTAGTPAPHAIKHMPCDPLTSLGMALQLATCT